MLKQELALPVTVGEEGVIFVTYCCLAVVLYPGHRTVVEEVAKHYGTLMLKRLHEEIGSRLILQTVFRGGTVPYYLSVQ
jgi:hypothetical protein